MSRCYIRNGVWSWSVERQLEALGDDFDPKALFQDALSADRAKRPSRVNPEWLTERASMLRPSGRPQDEIHVATLLALAVSEADLVAVLAAATNRSAAITSHESGMTYLPGGGAVEAALAIADWQDAKATARNAEGRLEGVRVAAERKRARTMQAVKVAKPLWRDSKPGRLTTAQIAEQVGLSEKTLFHELGRRPAIRKGISTP